MVHVPGLGVGVLYQPVLDPLLRSADWPADYLEIIPDTLWHDAGRGAHPRFDVQHGVRSMLESVRERMPILMHGIGLSIGSAGPLDEEYLEQFRSWADWLECPWVSEHLAYSMAATDEGPVVAGLTLPVPLEQSTVDLIGPRLELLSGLLGVPVALENNVYYFRTPGESLSEPGVLNRLCRWGASSILLDVHNLYVNVRNGVMEADAYLKELDLAAVREIHIAGGMEIDNFYVDAHSGLPPAEVWDLLDAVAPQCGNLGGVTFEMLGSWFDTVGGDGLNAVLDRARKSLAAQEGMAP